MRLIFDIGANLGEWTAKNYNEDDMFVLVEPNPALTEHLLNRFRGVSNVSVVGKAVSDKNDIEIPFYVCNNHWASSASDYYVQHGRFAKEFKWTPTKVKTITLDALINSYGRPDFIKVDVEGYELNVLRGLSSKAGAISFEWNEEHKPDTICAIAHCHKIGYTKFGLSEGDDYTYIPDTWEDYETFCDRVDALLNAPRASKWGMIYCK
jgi:FkbM family methyltransferase